MSTTDRDAAMISQQGTEPILQFFAFDHLRPELQNVSEPFSNLAALGTVEAFMSPMTAAFFRSCRRVRAAVAVDQPRQQLSRESCFTTRDPRHLGP